MYTHKVQLMRLRTAALLLVFAFPVMVSSARAQNAPRGLVELEERRRAGFWLAASLGAGREAFDVNDDALGYSSSLTEPTVALRLGGTVNEHLRLGGETIVWFHDVPGGTESLSSVLFVAQYYPLRRGPLFLKAGGGLGRSGVDFRDGVSVSDVGFAVAGHRAGRGLGAAVLLGGSRSGRLPGTATALRRGRGLPDRALTRGVDDS